MMMELLRDAVLTICRQAFSNYSSGELKVKCQIEVSTDVSQVFATYFEDVLRVDLSNECTSDNCSCELTEPFMSSDKESCIDCSCPNSCDITCSEHFPQVGKHTKLRVKRKSIDSSSALDLQISVRRRSSLDDSQCRHDLNPSSMELSHTQSSSSENLEIVAVDDLFSSSETRNLSSPNVGIFASGSRMTGGEDKCAQMRTSPLPCEKSKTQNTVIVSPGKNSSKLINDATTQKSEYQFSSSEEDLWNVNLFRDNNSSSNDRAKKYACPHCECSFSMLTNLRRHIKKVHHNIPMKSSPVKSCQMSLPTAVPDETLSKQPTNDTVSKKNCRYRHVCSVCKAVFTFRTNLTRHAKKVHGHVP